MCGISCFTSLINIIKVTVNAFQYCWFLSLHFDWNVSLGLLSSVSFKNNLNLNFISRSRKKTLYFQSCYKVEFLLRWRNRKVGDLVNILTLVPFSVIMGNSSGKTYHRTRHIGCWISDCCEIEESLSLFYAQRNWFCSDREMYSTAIDCAPALCKVNSENSLFFCFCILAFQTLLEAAVLVP